MGELLADGLVGLVLRWLAGGLCMNVHVCMNYIVNITHVLRFFYLFAVLMDSMLSHVLAFYKYCSSAQCQVFI